MDAGTGSDDRERQPMSTSSPTTAGASTAAEEVRRQVDALAWYHSIDVGHGVVTKGLSRSTTVDDFMPDFRGKTVLDIGAWDGYYSFLAERRGASRVVALDHYAWGVDIPAREAYWRECAEAGRMPDHGRDTADFWQPDLPGKRGFNLARELLGSKVEAVVGDFASMDLTELGTFDIVVYCGVLYHMKEPLTCLERVRSVTREVAVVETEALHVPTLEHLPLAEFRAGNEVNRDFGNWWMPNMASLRAMCRAAGFSSTTLQVGPPTAADSHRSSGSAVAGLTWEDLKEAVKGLRAIGRNVAGRALGRQDAGATPIATPVQHYRAVVHAHV